MPKNNKQIALEWDKTQEELKHLRKELVEAKLTICRLTDELTRMHASLEGRIIERDSARDELKALKAAFRRIGIEATQLAR